ncbi:MAG: hypothetical protein K0R02_541 [Rickettsiaceae bacterium]|jgi:uncharacterized membrane protein|nr:hypothetical protein [Rickettsiaceae bacterium]
MKETKKFFGTDSRLNKGYSETNLRESDSSFYRKRFEDIFPPVDIIEAYENLHEGATEKLIALAEKEQEHRQNMEKATLAVYERSKRLGIFFALFTVLIIGYVSLELFRLDKNLEAFIFFTVAYGAIFGVSFLYYIKSNKNRGERRIQASSNVVPITSQPNKGRKPFSGTRTNNYNNNSNSGSNSNTRRRRFN